MDIIEAMKNYSMPQVMVLSFYSAPMYRAIARDWRARSLVYLFLVLILCWTPGFVMVQRSVERGFQRIRENTIPQIPTLSIEKGIVKTPENKPYVLEITESGQSMRIVIDASGRYKSLEDAQAIVLITDKHAMVRRSASETRTYDFTRIGDRTFGPAEAGKILDQIEKWLGPVLFPLIFLLSFVKRFLQSIITALLGLLMIRWVESDLTFPALLSLAIVSMTPTLIFSTILVAGHATFPLQWLVLGFLNFGYFLFAINAASDKNAEDEV